MELKKQQWLVAGNVFFYVISLLINYASSIGMLSTLTVGEVSDRYFTFLTPADYAFSIWGLIYLSLATFLIAQFRGVYLKKRTSRFVAEVNYLFMMTCLFNSSWILLWVNEFIFASVIVIFLLLLTLLTMVFRLKISVIKFSLGKYLWVVIPFSLYFGWVLIASVVNLGAYLEYLQVNFLNEIKDLLRYIIIGISTMIYIILLWNRNIRVAAIVGIWGISSIGANFINNEVNYAYFCIAASSIMLLNLIFHIFIKGININKSGIWEIE